MTKEQMKKIMDDIIIILNNCNEEIENATEKRNKEIEVILKLNNIL